MDKSRLSPSARAFLKKMDAFDFSWWIVSVGVFVLIYSLGIRDLGVIIGIMVSFVFGGEAIFHYRQLSKVRKICEEYFANTPQKAIEAYQSHLAVVRFFVGIGIVGVVIFIISLLTL